MVLTTMRVRSPPSAPMVTKFDLTKYEKLYQDFDSGHDIRHCEEVRNFAVELGKKYAPDKLELIYVAATLHDIGLSVTREDHEQHGFEILKKDPDLQKVYTKEEFDQILEAVREHRASSGNPQGIVAKIVSDADKVSDGTNRAFQRAYNWGVANMPELSHQEQLLRAAQHLRLKFGPDGTGTRVYFEESHKKQDETYKPIFAALEKSDLAKMESFLGTNH